MKRTTVKSRGSVQSMLIDINVKSKENYRKRHTLESNLMKRLLKRAKSKLSTKIEFWDGCFLVDANRAELRSFFRKCDNGTPLESLELEIPEDYWDDMPHRLMAEARHEKCCHKVFFRGNRADAVADIGGFLVDRVLYEKPGDRISVAVIRGIYDDDDCYYIATITESGVVVAEEHYILEDKHIDEQVLGVYEIPDALNNKLEHLKEIDEVLRKNIHYNTTGYWG